MPSGECFPSIPGGIEKEGVHAGRSVADHQYKPHLSLHLSFISHPLSLAISHLNMHCRKTLWRTMQSYKKIDQPVYCRLCCYRAVWLCITEDKHTKKQYNTTKCFSRLNIIQIGYKPGFQQTFLPTATYNLLEQRGVMLQDTVYGHQTCNLLLSQTAVLFII